MSLLMSIKKSWSNCLEVTSSHSKNDLASVYIVKSTKTWFTTYGIQVLSWLANSSDPNPIESLLKIAKKRMAACRPTTLEQLKVSIKQAWSFITPIDCQRLVESMPRWVQAVIAASGGPTKLLKVHVHCFVLFYSTVWPLNLINLPYANILIYNRISLSSALTCNKISTEKTLQNTK